jgi:hypothetical protein
MCPDVRCLAVVLQQVIAEAMMAVLPGIDANDEAKTAAVFQFYTAVLSSIPALHGLGDEDDDLSAAIGGDVGFELPTSPRAMHVDNEVNTAGGRKSGPVYRLPLYLEDWVDQVSPMAAACISTLHCHCHSRDTKDKAAVRTLVDTSSLNT